MLGNYIFVLSGNIALSEIDLPEMSPDEIREAQMRIKKLASVHDFQIRWRLDNRGRKDSEGQKMRYREESEEANFESGKQFAKFKKNFEVFIHPAGFWEAEDGEWKGLSEDDIVEWYEKMLEEIFRVSENIPPTSLQLITEEQIQEFCRQLNEKYAFGKREINASSQIRNIPKTFPTTLWADVTEFTRLLIQLEKVDQVPELNLGKETIIDISEEGFKKRPYDPVQEFVSRWDPEKNFYWDEYSKIRTEKFARRMRSVSETHIQKSAGNSIYYVTQITRKSLYNALQGDLSDFLQENARSGRSGRLIRETNTYFKSEQILLAVMKKVEAAFQNFHGPERVEFIGGMGLSAEEKAQIQTIESARGPVDGNMG